MSADPNPAAAVAPWLCRADRLAAWLDQGGLPPGSAQAGWANETLRTARSVLNSLSAGAVAIPAELPDFVPCALAPLYGQAGPRAAARSPTGPVQPFPSWLAGWRPGALPPPDPARADQPSQDTAEMLRAHRDAVLRLGVWDSLRAMGASKLAQMGQAQLLSSLMRSISRPASAQPPCLAPALGFAASPAAAPFFNQALRKTLRHLALAYDPGGAAFTALAETPDFDMTGLAVERWTRAWTAAVAASYVDALFGTDTDRFASAQTRLWRRDNKRSTPLRFKPPEGLIALPTKGHKLNLDLWTGPVLAQVLAHQASRWQAPAAGHTWHRVTLSMHDLHQRDCGEQPDGRLTVLRGLSVGMLYQVVFIDQIASWLDQLGPEESTMTQAGPTSASNAVELRLPGGRAGQRTDIHIIIDWPADADAAGPASHARGLGSAGMRNAGPPTPVALDEEQRQVIEAWQQLQGATALPKPQRRLTPQDIGWQVAKPADALVPAEDGTHCRLGSAALWTAAGPDIEWLDLSLLVLYRQRRHELALRWGDDTTESSQAGPPRCWLSTDRSALAELQLSVAALHHASQSSQSCHWHCQLVGLGAVMLMTVDLDVATA